MRLVVVLALVASASGCDKLFSLTHVDRDADVDAPPCTPRGVATGKEHTCSVDHEGRVFCWGHNAYGESQPGGPGHVLEPARVVLPAPATQVTAGKYSSCALLEDATVWCWGNAELGELGGGPMDTGPGPKQVDAIPASVEVRAGGTTTCSRSRDDGTVWCWGGNKFRSAGQDTDVSCSSKEGCVRPGIVQNTAGSKALALGHRHGCVIDPTDHIACWGRDKEGQLGDNAAAEQRTAAAGIPVLGAISAAAAAGRHTCALDLGGAMQCWGEGIEYQLATGMTTDSGMPINSMIEGGRSLALGHNGGCALLADGNLSCWGAIDAGDGTAGVERTPTTTLLDGVVDVATHFNHTCAIAHGDIYCWGIDDHGQLGRGSRAVSLVPTAAGPAGELGLVGIDLVSAGDDHVCVRASGEIYCWGANDYAQLGADDLQWRYVPTKVSTALPAIDGLVAAYSRTCAWGNGEARCWGRGNSYALGNQLDGRDFAAPQTVATDTVRQIALGGNFLCALHTDGTVICFGYNTSGQVGATPGSPASSKTGNNPGVTDIQTITAGRAHACALSNTGVVSCWGNNESGQLGDGTKVPRGTPAVVGTIGVAVDVQAGDSSTCARDMTGSIWCWGSNSSGALGDGTHTTQLTPVKVALPNGRTATDLSVRGQHACARLDDGSVVCWGDGETGQLGYGGESDQPAPVLVPGFAGATQLAVGGLGTCALLPGGTLSCTGDHRMLANGDMTRSVPQLTVRSACAD